MLDRMETPTCSPATIISYTFKKKKKKKALVVASATRRLDSGGSVHLFITMLLAGNLYHREAKHWSSSLRSVTSIKSAARQQEGSY